MKRNSFLFFLVGTFVFFTGGNVFSQRSNFRAVNDTIDLYSGMPVTIDLTANDTIPPGFTYTLLGGAPNCYSSVTTSAAGTFRTYISRIGFDGVCRGKYWLKHQDSASFDTSTAWVFFRLHDQGFDSLYINNINARFLAHGIHFYGDDKPRFEVPKFSGKTTIFCNTLWIGGLSEDSILHLAAQRYGQGPYTAAAWTKFDYFVGPVMDSLAYSFSGDSLWSYIWNLKRTEIDYHKTHWNSSGYLPIHDIITWPGNGNVSLGQAAQLAPYFDRNNDGTYEPFDGDYPLIKGDQSLFFIFNDDRGFHYETEGNKLRAEIHGMAYAFDMPEDSAFNNTVFLNYKIFNRSSKTYHDTYIGTFTDLDIGWDNDDYIGCDPLRGYYYGYNGKPVDGTGQPGSYGDHPPAQSVAILAGAYMDPDGTDNPKTDSTGIQLCNESVNGTGFGDTIVDNERLGMSIFMEQSFGGSWFPTYDYAPDYYNFLLGNRRDGTSMIYGGNAHATTGGYGPECNFMFPGTSDTLNWGTGCMPPNGPVNWTEKTALNYPSDRRGICSTGPFTFLPGSVHELDLAFTFARDLSDTSEFCSLAKLQNFSDVIRNAFLTNTLPNGQSFNGIGKDQQKRTGSLKIYPNPAYKTVTLDFNTEIRGSATIRVFNSLGREVLTQVLHMSGNRGILDVSELPNGFYSVIVRYQDMSVSSKLVILR